MPVIIGALYNYFSKVYQLQFLRHAKEAEILEALKLRSAFFLKDYRLASKNFSRLQVEQVISILREYDMKSKGVDYVSTGKEGGGLLKEMIWKILH